MRSEAYNLFIAQLGACTRSLNAEIKQQIIDVNAVDTGLMKNTTKVKITYDEKTDVFTIQDADGIKTTDYYIFVDKGTKFITPRNITDKFLKRPKVVAALDKLLDRYIDWIIDRQFEVNAI
jgi:hypothetical protein